MARYSGSDRPAWRMNHTGVRSTSSRRAARTRSGSLTASRVALIVNRVGEHPVTAGPLAPRWLAWSLERPRAGVTSTARVSVENAGTATWRCHGADGVRASFHWLDPLGNPIVWDGPRTDAAPHRRPGRAGRARARRDGAAATRAPYRLAFDLVEEHRFWFAEVGATPARRRDRGRAADRGADARRSQSTGAPIPATTAALAAQEERLAGDEAGAVAVAHLVAGAIPPPGWSRLLLDAHAEGWAAVATAIVPAGRDRELDPWRGERRPQPPLRPAAAPALAPRRRRAHGASRPAGLRRRRRALRRPGRRHTSAAIRSSTALKTTAPSTSATTVSTTR